MSANIYLLVITNVPSRVGSVLSKKNLTVTLDISQRIVDESSPGGYIVRPLSHILSEDTVMTLRVPSFEAGELVFTDHEGQELSGRKRQVNVPGVAWAVFDPHHEIEAAVTAAKEARALWEKSEHEALELLNSTMTDAELNDYAF